VTSYAPNDQISAQSRTIGGSGTAVNTTYQYDPAARQTTITDYVSGGSALATYIYSYDKSDRVTTMVDAEGTYTYTYDNSNELTNVDESGTQAESYSYDLNGNRTGTGYSTTVMNETLTSPGLVTYTYDKAGNTISADSGGTFATYSYDYRNRLTEVTQGGTVIATYVYNPLDQRIGIQESGSTNWTVYNGTSADASPYADFNGSGTLLTRYVYGPGMVDEAVVDELLARTSSGGTIAWYLPDKLGSVRDIVSSAGLVLDHIVYDSFGNILTETIAGNGDRFKFAGMQYDSATGQYYDHARWYGPGIGRFDSQDPLRFTARDADLYRYVRNSPSSTTDTSGLQEAPPRDPYHPPFEDPISYFLYYYWQLPYRLEPGTGGMGGSGNPRLTPPLRKIPTTPAPPGFQAPQKGPPLTFDAQIAPPHASEPEVDESLPFLLGLPDNTPPVEDEPGLLPPKIEVPKNPIQLPKGPLPRLPDVWGPPQTPEEFLENMYTPKLDQDGTTPKPDAPM
jgi:RHS repeat-associated protein